MKKNNKKVITFETSPIVVYIINNAEKLGIIIILIELLIYLFCQEKLRFNAIMLSIFITFIPFFILKLSSKKFAYKIVINFACNKLTLYKFNNHPPIDISFSDIKKIYIKGYIVFKLQEQKIYYNDANDQNLIYYLNMITPVQN